jgi:hypothetical protein
MLKLSGITMRAPLGIRPNAVIVLSISRPLPTGFAASTHRTVPKVVEANGQPSADRQCVLYLAVQVLRDRMARLYGNLDWNKTKVNLVASEVDNFSGVIVPIDDVQNLSRI